MASPEIRFFIKAVLDDKGKNNYRMVFYGK